MGSLALAAALGVGTALDAADRGAPLPAAALAVALLAAGLLIGRWEPVPLALLVLGALYVAPDGDRALPAPVYASTLLVIGELAFWSVDARLRLRAEPGADAPRLVALLVVAVVAIPVGALALLAGDAGAERSDLLTAVGAAAIVGCAGLLVALSRRTA